MLSNTIPQAFRGKPCGPGGGLEGWEKRGTRGEGGDVAPEGYGELGKGHVQVPGAALVILSVREAELEVGGEEEGVLGSEGGEVAWSGCCSPAGADCQPLFRVRW
jgi:hypothetical protein